MREITGYDVIVVGGGPGGVGAAVAAGRSGAKTLLIEREGCLGGAATTMLVNPFMPCTTRPKDDKTPCRLANAGLFIEIMRRLERRGMGALNKWGAGGFDDETLKLVLDEVAAEAGVQVLFHTTLYDVERNDGAVTAVLAAHNSGPLRIPGRVFVDATGDALLAERAGCEIMFGNEEGVVMPMTLFFVLDGIDYGVFPWGELKKLCQEGPAHTPALVNTNLSCMHRSPAGLLYMNAIRVPGNTLDPLDVTKAEIEGRRRVHNFVAWMRANVPGCASVRLVKTGTHVGIRESRRVVGDYIITGDDFSTCARFDDAIACCTYPVDIHGQAQGQTTIRELPPDGYYQIPYRCLTPKGKTNLLMAGRSISADVTLHSSVRVMPPVMNIGEAAGHAAALSLPKGDVRAVEIKALQKRIRANGGALDPLPM